MIKQVSKTIVPLMAAGVLFAGFAVTAAKAQYIGGALAPAYLAIGTWEGSAPVINVMTGGNLQGHRAKRLQYKLKRRAVRLGIDPDKVWISPFRRLPISWKASPHVMDAYLIRTYKQ